MVRPLGEWFYVTGVEVLHNYVLRLTFDDAMQQVIDFGPLLYGEMFEPLRDPAVFSQVTVNGESGTIEWPTGADYNPVILHDWPEYKDTIIADLLERYPVKAAA